MRVMVFVKGSEKNLSDDEPTAEMLHEMRKYNDDLKKAGILVSAEGLTRSRRAKRIVFADSARVVVDGPFAETKELVAGYWIWSVKDMDEAVDWAKRCPRPMPAPCELEIRPIGGN